jgi:hypothetical protein
MYLLSAALHFLTTVSLLTTILHGLASLDTVSTQPFHFKPPLLRSLGSVIALLCLPVEAGCLGVMRCWGMGQSVQVFFIGVYMVPGCFIAIGLAMVCVALAWQMRIDAKVLPGTQREGLRLKQDKPGELEAVEDGEMEGGPLKQNKSEESVKLASPAV